MLSPVVGLEHAGGVKNFSVGICIGAPLTARSSIVLGTDPLHRSWQSTKE